MNNMMEPKIRFKGFEGEWKAEDFQNSFDSLRNNSLSRAELADDGKIANIHYGDVLIKYSECIDTSVDKLTYILDNGIGKNLVKNGALKRGDIIFADAAEDSTVGKCSELLCKDNELIVSGLHTIACRPRLNVAEKYLGYYLNSPAYHNQLLPHIQGTKISSISKKAINTTFVVFPTQKAEQQEIASYFTSLDSQISASTSRLASLKQMKAASLQAMFPQEGETVPKIRFKGFEGEWKKVKVSTLLEERREFNKMSDEYPLMAFIANVGVADKGDRYDRSSLVNDVENKLYKKTDLGDFIYSSNNLETGSIGLNRYGKATISPVYSIFKCTDKSNYDFIGCAFTRKEFINNMVKWRQGVMYGQWRIHESDFLVIEILVPSIEEQKCIGNYFTSLDRQISLQSQRLEKLKQIKSACLDKMFV